jgi:penicillin-insensitive murein endopeptidase
VSAPAAPLALLLSLSIQLSDPDAGPNPSSAALSSAALWSAQRSPAPGPAQAIGAYAGGCLQGAVPLPEHGAGYELLHPSRRRTFGHPEMVAYIERLAAAAAAGKAAGGRARPPLVIGDLSQARGGPTPSGHRSHQSGLDADIGYAAPVGLPAGRLKPRDRERLAPPAVVDLRTNQMTAAWGPRVARLLATAASDAAVDRIFVHPAVKRALCQGPARAAEWLARVRPWWGHHDHFHVRLKCPPQSPLCQPQDPLPPAEGSGCGESLAWWFSDDAQATRARRQQAEKSQAAPPLPAACAALVAPGG